MALGSRGLHCRAGCGAHPRLPQPAQQIRLHDNVPRGGDLIGHLACPVAQAEDLMDHHHHRRLALALRVHHPGLQIASASLVDRHVLAMTRALFQVGLRPILRMKLWDAARCTRSQHHGHHTAKTLVSHAQESTQRAPCLAHELVDVIGPEANSRSRQSPPPSPPLGSLLRRPMADRAAAHAPDSKAAKSAATRAPVP